MTTSKNKTERSGKTTPATQRLKRWLCRIAIALVVLIGVYVLFRILYPVWINARLPADAPRIAFSVDNSLLGRIGVTDATYQRVMAAAGGRLITLRPNAAGDPVDPKAVEALIERKQIDGVLLTGGGDVDPNLYGGDPNTTMLVHRLRDDFEIALIRAARQRGLPILGICRGCQIINVALGGTIRNLRKEPELKQQHLILKGHPVDLIPDSKLAEILGVTHLPKVVSLHGNAVRELAPGVRIAATGPGNIIEAIEADSGDQAGWIVGIQWHPELMVTRPSWPCFFNSRAGRPRHSEVQNKVYTILVDRARNVRDRDSSTNQAFPAKIPLDKPTDRKLSAAMERMYDVWNPHEDRGNEFFSNFKYSRLEGFSREPNVSRRDPSKVIRVDGNYYVYYTCRRTEGPPVGPKKATDTIPSRDWDLAEIWYATSKDGFRWTEHGPAVRRPTKGQFGWRSNCTPDILVFKGRYYLYYQAYSVVIAGGDICPVTVAESDSPAGPFRALGRPVVSPGEPNDWDCSCIHDPSPLIYKGRIYLYYKGSPGQKRGGDNLIRAQGVAIAEYPAGPFKKSPLNPVLNSGHETCLWPYREGIAALVSLDGPEKNTIQYAPDGVNFDVKALLQVPPIAPGPYIRDAFADNQDGRGITWGLCHINPDGGGSMNDSILARFDCDLSRDVDIQFFKRNNLRFDEQTYFQRILVLPEYMRKQRIRSSLFQ